MSEQRGVAVVGSGYWGRNLVRNFAQMGVLRAIVDLNADQARALADEFGCEVADYEAALADEAVSGIAIAAPAPLHADLALQAIERGRHVFVEKPIALSMEDGERVGQAAEKAGRVLMVGHLLQYHPVYRALADVVAGGAIGALRYVSSNRMSMGKLRSEEDVLWSFAPHDISMILGLVGERPDTVTSHGTRVVSELSDTAHCHMRFPSGVGAHVYTSWISPFKEQKLVAVGETGSLVFDDTVDWNDKLVQVDHAVMNGALLKQPPRAVTVERSEPLRAECEHFVAAMNGAEVRTDAREALAVLDVLQRATIDAPAGSRS